MAYLVKDVTTADGTIKKQFYKLVGMQDANNQTVEVQVWDGEYNQTELEFVKANYQNQMDEVDAKLAFFVVQFYSYDLQDDRPRNQKN